MEVNTPVFSSPPAASPGTPGALMEKEIPPSLPPAGAVLTEPPEMDGTAGHLTQEKWDK